MRLMNRPMSPSRTSSEREPSRHRPGGRGRPFAAIATAVALIALSAGVFTLLASRGRSSVAVTPTATAKPACSPAKATASMPAHASVRSIAAASADDAWAVGSVWDPQAQTPPATLMLHLQDCHWAPVGTPIATAELLSVSTTSASEGWAVGATMKRDDLPGANGQPRNDWLEDQLLVLHYVGGSWQRVAVPGDAQVIAARVKMISADEGWMLLDHGKRTTIVNSTTTVSSYSYTLLHYQHGAWTEVPLTFAKPYTLVWNLDARESGEVWLVGDESGSPVVAHYANGAWAQWTGGDIGADAGQLFAVSEVSPSDVWVGSNALYHFDGTSWTKATVQGATASQQSLIRQIVMTSPTDGWAFDDSGFGMLRPGSGQVTALRYAQGRWQSVHVAVAGGDTTASVSGLATTSQTQGWAIGDHFVPTDIGGITQGTLLYYDSGAWGVVRQ